LVVATEEERAGMSQTNAPIYVILSTEDLTQAQVDEINQLTRELGASLESQPDAVESVSYSGKDSLPQGTKVALEVLLAEQVIMEVSPIVIKWVLGKIDSAIKSFSARRGKPVKAKVIVGSREVQISPKTTPQELTKAAQQVNAVSELSPGKRYALVIGNSNYRDERLADLKSSIVDAERFARVLADPNLGAFTHVETLINKTHDVIENAIEKFFNNKLREDMLLLYFSGHGIKSQGGQLFLAAQNTSSDLLRSTGVSANFIKENMGESNSQRQVLILDCCYGGAIVEGSKSNNALGQSINSVLSFQPTGFGRIIITASEAMQYAFDGKHVEGMTQNSAFTRHLIEGLETGRADTDNNGLIDIDELYQYAYKHVTPQQTPNITSTAQEGRMYIGLNPNPAVQMAELSDQLQQAMLSETRLHRQGAVSELTRMLRSPDPSVMMAAEIALRKMVNDDSKSVADAARDAIDQYFSAHAVSAQKVPLPEPAATKSSSVEYIASSPPVGVTTDIHPKATTFPSNPPVYNRRNENAGGCLNVILPGIAHALVGNWTRAIITFVLVIVASTVLGGVALFDFGICSGPLALGMLVLLFFEGRKAFHKDNERRS
jgi:uncharacterized caspase-like protein